MSQVASAMPAWKAAWMGTRATAIMEELSGLSSVASAIVASMRGGTFGSTGSRAVAASMSTARRAARALRRSSEAPEELPDVADQQVGLLHGREVAAAVKLRPVHDVVRPLGEGPDRADDLLRKDRHPGGRRVPHPPGPLAGVRGLVV